MAGPPRIVTLLTDFGLQDYFVAAMKGVMLSLNPELSLIDISHMIPSHDVVAAAFTLGQAYSYFPPSTIHLAVVDPGVGTARKALAASADGHYFVAPDNGILTYVLEKAEDMRIHEIAESHYFRRPISSTFHGRDVFAPVAAWISRNISLQQLGPALEKPVRLSLPKLTRVRDTLFQATILAVDKFGNLITNLRPEDLPVYRDRPSGSCKILLRQREIATFRKTYAEGKEGELFVVPGSAGYLEIVVRNGSAAALLEAGSGAIIGVILS